MLRLIDHLKTDSVFIHHTFASMMHRSI